MACRMKCIELNSDISYSYELINPGQQFLRHISDNYNFSPERKLHTPCKTVVSALPCSLQDALERVRVVSIWKRKRVSVLVA